MSCLLSHVQCNDQVCCHIRYKTTDAEQITWTNLLLQQRHKKQKASGQNEKTDGATTFGGSKEKHCHRIVCAVKDERLPRLKGQRLYYVMPDARVCS